MNTVDPGRGVPIPAPGAAGPGFGDWWDSMLWHRVLRSPVLGLRPGRIGLSFFFVVGVLLLLMLGHAVDRQLVTDPRPVPQPAPGEDDPFALFRLFVLTPVMWLRGWPVTTLIVGPVAFLLGAVLLGAVSRISAEEFSRARFVPWNEGLAFSARLWGSVAGAIVGPVVLIWFVALKLTVLGWALLNWPGLNVIGGLFYGLFMLGALIAVIVGVAYLLGWWMLIPAAVCDGADAIDSVQRAYAYVLARPVRLLIYLVLGIAAVLVVTAFLWVIATWTIGFAMRTTGALARPITWEMLWWGSFGNPSPEAALDAANGPQGSYAVAAAFIRIWVLVPMLLVLASFVSMLASMSTVLYLAMRRVCDGQDLGELWTPGLIEAQMAQVMASRARASGNAGRAEGNGSGENRVAEFDSPDGP
jgi:hypothetical protein